LNEAIVQYEQRQWRGGCANGSCQVPRSPTPPMASEPLVPVDQAKLAGGKDRTLLPWRKEAEAKDDAQDARIDKLIGLMEVQVQRPGTSVDVAVGRRPEREETPARQRSPLLGGLFVMAGVVCGFVIYFATQKGE